MIVDTVKGCAYVLTCTTACTVHAVFDGASPLLVLEASKEGQYGFVAPTDAVEVSDEHALVIITDWKQFRVPSWPVMRKTMHGRIIIDGRNMYDIREVREEGFIYKRIG